LKRNISYSKNYKLISSLSLKGNPKRNLKVKNGDFYYNTGRKRNTERVNLF